MWLCAIERGDKSTLGSLDKDSDQTEHVSLFSHTCLDLLYTKGGIEVNTIRT
jgi:hypothetical protein